MNKLKHVALTSMAHLVCNESGQDLVEYALIAGLLVLAAVVCVRSVQTSVANAISQEAANFLASF